jgi:hypothetical protein
MEPKLSSRIDPIPAWVAWYRKMITIRSVSNRTWRGPIGQANYLTQIAEIQQRAVATSDMAMKTSAFWKMENLSSIFLKQAQPGQTLNDPSLRVEICPIAHCGMGIAAVEMVRFDPARLAAVVDSFSHPDYRLFAYEGAGAMLALYEPDLFSAMAKVFGALRLLPFVPLDRPPTEPFLKSFPRQIRRLIAHGYGRMLYFKNSSIAGAIRASLRAAPLDAAASIQGVAFAYAMVNNRDLTRVFRAARNLDTANLRRPFEDGLVYALEFWEWMAPGFLLALATRLPVESHLIAAAQEEIDACRTRGYLEAFGFIRRSPAHAPPT